VNNDLLFDDNEGEVDIDDSYLQSQFSYMYSNEEDDLIDANVMGESFKKREAIFNGEEDVPDSRAGKNPQTVLEVSEE
jgi:hypothetical protein